DVRKHAVHVRLNDACELMFRGRIKRGPFTSPATPRLRRGSLRCQLAEPKLASASEGWWSQTGSNRRPHACKARALPAELWPRNQKTNALRAGSQHEVPSARLRSFGATPGTLRSTQSVAVPRGAERRSVVGLGRLELPTSRLSSARSNQLSYKPLTRGASHAHNRRRTPDAFAQRSPQAACSSAKKEKRRRRNPACGTQRS